MNIYSFIPLRSGSKSIPLKNIKEIAKKPLAQWVIDSSNKSKYINETFISIDSEIISNKLKNANIHWRSPQTSTDDASSEMALIEFCETLNEEDIVVFIQATSPLLSTEEIDIGIESILNGSYDSVLSVVRQKKFIWSENNIPNYDIKNRPRRQDWDGILIENGAFYISKAKDIIYNKCRISGDIGLIECDEKTYYEIDELSDWAIVEKLLENK